MKSIVRNTSQRRAWITAGVFVVAALLLTGWFIKSGTTPWNAVGVLAINASAPDEPFPELDTSTLSVRRQQIIMLTEQEYNSKSPGTKYSEGVKEAWCADFLSWVMKAAGAPFANPNSGSWRIPGVYTLREYYESTGKFRAANSGYTPLPGDAVLYYDSPVFGTHVNIVLENKNGVLTTIGGNENGKIRVYKNNAKNYKGLVGYGAAE